MARVKNGAVTKARHKKVLKQAKGYFGSKHRLYKTAKEQLMHSGQYAFRDRKQKKREFRKLWITRINAACRQNDISYSKFINGLSSIMTRFLRLKAISFVFFMLYPPKNDDNIITKLICQKKYFFK